MRQTQALISIHAMSPSLIHRAATAARMVAVPSINLRIPTTQKTTTLNRNRFNTNPNIETRRDRLVHQEDGTISRPHLDASSLSTTRIHPSFLFLSSMSAIDPVASTSTIASSSALSKHQLQQLFSIHGTNDIQTKQGIKTNSKALPPFTVVMLRYQALSARNKNVRTEDGLHKMKHTGDLDRVNGNGNGKGGGNEEHAEEQSMEEDNREKED